MATVKTKSLRFLGQGAFQMYRCADVDDWHAKDREVRVLSEEVADRLLEQFPDCFEEVVKAKATAKPATKPAEKKGDA